MSKNKQNNITIQTNDNTKTSSSWYFTKRLILLSIISIIIWQIFEGINNGPTKPPTIIKNITKIFSSDKSTMSAEPSGTIAPGVVTGLISTVGLLFGLSFIWFIFRRQGTRVFRNELLKDKRFGEKGGGPRTRFRRFLLHTRFSRKTLDKIYKALEQGAKSRGEADKAMKKAWLHEKEVGKSLFGKIEEFIGTESFYKEGLENEKFNKEADFI